MADALCVSQSTRHWWAFTLETKAKPWLQRINGSLGEVIQTEARGEQRKTEKARSIDTEAGMEVGMEEKENALFRLMGEKKYKKRGTKRRGEIGKCPWDK